jgi:hypothetical protein
LFDVVFAIPPAGGVSTSVFWIVIEWVCPLLDDEVKALDVPPGGFGVVEPLQLEKARATSTTAHSPAKPIIDLFPDMTDSPLRSDMPHTG